LRWPTQSWAFIPPILDGGSEVGLHRLDLLVAGLIVVELKAVEAIEDVHFAVFRSYLRATGRERGLILNFGQANAGIKRSHCLPTAIP